MSIYTLQRLFDDLASGELSQINLNGEDSVEKTFNTIAKNSIVSHLNLGLTELFSRFPLNQKEVVIQLYPHITQYFLDSKYAISNSSSTESNKYIIDSLYYPFADDVLRLESCYTELGEELYINDVSREYSVFTSDYKSIQVPFPELEIALSFSYRAKHAQISYSEGVDANSVPINIPPYLYEALLYYIAYRVHKARHNQEARADSLQYYQLFNNRCDEMERRNMFNDSIAGSNQILDTNGWM